MIRLYELRREFGLSPREAAEAGGVSINSYKTYERTGHPLPAETVINLAKYYDVSTDYLLGVSEKRKPDDIEAILDKAIESSELDESAAAYSQKRTAEYAIMLSRLRELRQSEDFDPILIARIIGCKPEQYFKMEIGSEPIALSELITLAKFYEVSLDYLCGLTSDRRHYR